MSGKGDAPRPYSVDLDTFASNWDAIFSKKQVGLGRVAEASSSNLEHVGSIPTAPANIRLVYIDGDWGTYCNGTVHFKAMRACEQVADERWPPCTCKPMYIDPESGAQVDENWWPGDPVGYGAQ